MKHFPMVQNPLKQKCTAMLSMLLLLFFAVLPQVALAVDVSSLPEHDESITFTAITGTDGYENENYENLFDGNTDTKFCVKATNEIEVIFRASKAGNLVGYTITTGNDNIYFTHRNPRSWKLYGSMSAEGNWTLLETINDDEILRDLNSTAFTYATPNADKGKYEYFKWVVSANQGATSMQVSELKLYLQPCSHKNADGTSALGDKIGSYEATCLDYAHDLYHCALCDRDVKEYTGSTYGAHKITHVDAAEPTCTVAGHTAYYTCTVCHRYFSDAEGTQQIATNSVLITAKGHHFVNGICENCHESDPRDNAFNHSDNDISVTITDPSAYPWKYDENDQTIHSSNAGIKNTTSSYEVKFTSSKSFLVTFDYGASSEYARDFASLTIDGVPYSMYTGNENESNYNNTFNHVFAAGTHTIAFGYTKDAYGDKGKDIAYVSNIRATTDLSDAKTQDIIYATKLTGDDNKPYIKLAYGPWAESSFNVTDSYTAATLFRESKVVIDESMKNYKLTSMRYFFQKFNPTTISGMENLITDDVTDYSFMCSQCTALTSIDLSHLNTSKARSLHAMFYNCSRLKSIDISYFNTANVEDMYGVFANCTGLTSLTFPSTFTTDKVRQMDNMFYGCRALQSLDLSTFSTPNLENMVEMFRGCINMTSLKFSPAFVTDNVTNMRGLFYGCEKLEGVDLSSFRTGKVRSFSDMFYWCKALKTLDLTSFSTQSTVYSTRMFNTCDVLSTIYVSDGFVPQKYYTDDMFGNCPKLVGAVSYDVSQVDGKMANYKTGYFKTYYQVGDTKHELVGENPKVEEDINFSDDQPLKVIVPFTATSITYNRATANNRWGSVCLPYAVNAPANCKFYTLSSIKDDANTGEGIIMVSETSHLDAGTPAFFYVGDANTQTAMDFLATDAAVSNTLVDNSASPKYGLYLKGTFAEQEIDNGYVLMNNAMWSVDAVKAQTHKTVNTKPFRAYLATVPSTAASNAQKLTFSPITSTGINAVINGLNEDNAAIYDANGRRQSSLQRGINIIRKANGESVKVIVK